LGESEKAIKGLFAQARKMKPSILFFDEIDSLCSSRSNKDSDSTRRVKTELLIQMQGISSHSEGILVLASTNRPWELDSAIRRRFEKRIHIPLPNLSDRIKIFQLHCVRTDVQLSLDDWTEIGTLSEGYTPSDISQVVKNAIMEPVRKLYTAKYFRFVGEKICVSEKSDTKSFQSTFDMINPNLLIVPTVVKEDFIKSLGTIKKSLSSDDLIKIDEFTQQFGI
jgi:vacuolar protein-sorting-associated protein 4